MIIPKSEKKEKRIEIDLNGSQGNAFYLMGVAKGLSKQTGKDFTAIQKRMTTGDYNNLLKVFEEEFGDHVVMYK
jgi:hypothetical protein